MLEDVQWWRGRILERWDVVAHGYGNNKLGTISLGCHQVDTLLSSVDVDDRIPY